MKTKLTLVLALLLSAVCFPAFAQGTAFTYQGRLNDGANVANGNYDLMFTVFDAANGGSPIAGPLTNAATDVSNGLFIVTLNFGNGIFTGLERWLEIGVRTNGGASFTTLDPRQQLTATPYAVTAGNLTGTLQATQLTGTLPSERLSGVYSGAVTFSNASNSFTGNLTGNATSATTSGLVTNGDLSINVDAVPQFDAALRLSNQISIVIFGDSVGTYLWRAMPKLMDNYSTFPTAGGALRYSGYTDGWGNWLNSLNSGYGSTNYDTVPDAWWGDSQIYVVSSGNTNYWSSGRQYQATGKLNGNLLKFWYLAASSNGTVRVETSIDGTNWTSQIVQDQSVPARGLICTNVNLDTADYYVRISADSGRCQYLWPQIVNTNARAFHIANLCAGGKSMVSFLAMGTNNISTLLTNIWPKPTMIVYCDTKEVSSYTNWPGVKWLLDNYAPGSDVVLGKPQPSTVPSIENDPAFGAYYQALVFNEIARTNKIPFIDSRSSFADINRSLRLGYYTDLIHFNLSGQDALSADFWTRLKIVPRLMAIPTSFVAGRNLANAESESSFRVLDSSNAGRRFYVTNGWGPSRMAIYFDSPAPDGSNWSIAGDNNVLGFKSPSGFYFYTASDYSGGGRWNQSGGLTLWGLAFDHANDDPGRGGLIVVGNRTNYGTGQYYGTEYMGTVVATNLIGNAGALTNISTAYNTSTGTGTFPLSATTFVTNTASYDREYYIYSGALTGIALRLTNGVVLPVGTTGPATVRVPNNAWLILTNGATRSGRYSWRGL